LLRDSLHYAYVECRKSRENVPFLKFETNAYSLSTATRRKALAYLFNDALSSAYVTYAANNRMWRDMGRSGPGLFKSIIPSKAKR